MISTRALDAASLIEDALDVLEARPRGREAPAPLVARGWDGFLRGLADDELEAIERGGLDAPWPSRTPASLHGFIARARHVVQLPVLVHASAEPEFRRHTSRRKDAQVAAFAQLVGAHARDAQRIVDVGSGHGHLTRDIALRAERPVVGLERDARLLERARELATQQGAAAQFLLVDVVRQGLALADGDCIIGLHACGELGDEMVRALGEASAHASLILVGCCPQKRRADARTPLAGGIPLSRGLLGLGNLSAGDDGVEASRAENLAARERRIALAWLLEQAGLDVKPHAELMGLNRRAAHRPLVDVAARVFARLGRTPPSQAMLEDAARVARETAALVRRWAVPRHSLARALEVAILLDRARFLEERGLVVHAGEVFPREVSPRNLALIASR